MAAPQEQPGPVRGRGNRGRGRGGRGRGGPSGGFAPTIAGSFDPEHPAFLAEKWSKKLGRDLESVEVKYTPTGCTVVLTGMAGTPFATLRGGSIAEYRQLAEAANAQTPAQKLSGLRRKYEDRVGAVPTNFPTTWEDQAVEAWINGLPLDGRRRLRMSQKQFLELHPNGVAV